MMGDCDLVTMEFDVGVLSRQKRWSGCAPHSVI